MRCFRGKRCDFDFSRFAVVYIGGRGAADKCDNRTVIGNSCLYKCFYIRFIPYSDFELRTDFNRRINPNKTIKGRIIFFIFDDSLSALFDCSNSKQMALDDYHVGQRTCFVMIGVHCGKMRPVQYFYLEKLPLNHYHIGE